MENNKLYTRLNEYRNSDNYPFHMPGHKRNEDYINSNGIDGASPYSYDITEIDGFDNLHKPEGVIKDRLNQVSQYYESKRSYYLVNGSTCGILSSISALCQGNKKLLMARNSHKAAYNSVFINKLDAIYIAPDIIDEYGIDGGINPNKLENILMNNNLYEELGAVYITSPTYEGVVSDIKEISSICHKYKVPLIVDEAHGAHFSMNEAFPRSALEYGADIVIQSLHKTLPALTQTAILHIGRDSEIDVSEIERYLAIYQTSSPSYVLMGSIDRCMDEIMGDIFIEFELYVKSLQDFKYKTEKFTNIKIMGSEIIGRNSVFDFDISKVVIFPRSNIYSGNMVYDKLRTNHHIQLEMASLTYAIGMTSIMDTAEGFDRLYKGLEDMDRDIRLYEKPGFKEKKIQVIYGEPVICMKISDGVYMEKTARPIQKAEGCISGEFIYLYPPGVPLIAPGEMFTRQLIEYIQECKSRNMNITGLCDGDSSVIVIREQWNTLQFKHI